jgi:hypothetical protein
MENEKVLDPYRETKLKASKNYRVAHKQYYADYQRKYYHNKLKLNPEYVENQRKKSIQRYYKLKEQKQETNI